MTTTDTQTMSPATEEMPVYTVRIPLIAPTVEELLHAKDTPDGVPIKGIITAEMTEEKFHELFGADTDIRPQLIYPHVVREGDMGWKCYVSPEDPAYGNWLIYEIAGRICTMDDLIHENPEQWDSETWGDLSTTDKLEPLSPRAVWYFMQEFAQVSNPEDQGDSYTDDLASTCGLQVEDFTYSFP